MPVNLAQFVSGLITAVVFALGAWRWRALGRSGALAAFLLGTVIFGLGGPGWSVLLIGFFLTSSALSLLFKQRKVEFNAAFSKGSQRDAGQVLANGGIAGLCVLLYSFLPGAGWAWAAFAASLAAANADTWATELGVLSRSTPRLITTWQRVPAGTSGGITPLGSLAAFGGALFIALLALPLWPAEAAGAATPLARLALITLAGFCGSLVDSLVGATLQAVYYCPACAKETERHPLHTCGAETQRLRGWHWLDNDWVNAACTLSAALLSLLFISTNFWN